MGKLELFKRSSRTLCAIAFLGAMVVTSDGCANNGECQWVTIDAGDGCEAFEVTTTDSSACLQEYGCRIEQGCKPVDCRGLRDSASCESRSHCEWFEHGTSSSCEEQSDPCTDLIEASCRALPSTCVWGPVCRGEVVPCDGMGEDACHRAFYCMWYRRPNF